MLHCTYICVVVCVCVCCCDIAGRVACSVHVSDLYIEKSVVCAQKFERRREIFLCVRVAFSQPNHPKSVHSRAAIRFFFLLVLLFLLLVERQFFFSHVLCCCACFPKKSSSQETVFYCLRHGAHHCVSEHQQKEGGMNRMCVCVIDGEVWCFFWLWITLYTNYCTHKATGGKRRVLSKKRLHNVHVLPSLDKLVKLE